MKRNKLYAFLLSAIIVWLCDFVSKSFMDSALPYAHKMTLLPNIISLEKVYNTGAAFSILQNNAAILSAISIATIIIILFYVIRNRKTIKNIEAIGLGCVAGGALGNLVDRLSLGYVIDFLQVEFINFPIFNFADIFINIGVIILLISIIFNENDR